MSDRVTAESDDLFSFFIHGKAYESELGDVEQHLRNARIQAGDTLGFSGNVPNIELTLRRFSSAVANNNQFVCDIHDALMDFGITETPLTTAFTTDIGRAMATAGHSLPGEVFGLSTQEAAAEREARGAVYDAIREGLSPSEAGLPPEYFPWRYRQLIESDAVIDAIWVKRDEIDGSTWNPFDTDRDAFTEVHAVYKTKKQERDELASRLGANDDSGVSPLRAAALLGHWTNDREWEGAKYGDWVNRFYGYNLGAYSNGTMDLKAPTVKFKSNQFRYIGEQLATEPKAALAFYNQIGLQHTAFLPTTLIDNVKASDDDEVVGRAMRDYAIALAYASQQRNADGSPKLSFSGSELLAEPLPKRLTGSGSRHEVYHQSFLFGSGDFDNSFLADAASESVLQAQHNSHATNTIISYRRQEEDDFSLPIGRGEDPRNILLSRSSEDLTTAAAVVTRLSERYSNHDLLLIPKQRFRLSYSGRTAFTVPVKAGAPIESLLVAAGADDRAANLLIHAAAENPDQGFRDGHVAAGMDGLLAQHLTLMYPEAALEPAGIERTTINDRTLESGSPHETFRYRDIKADHWKTTHNKVLSYGQGNLIAEQADELLNHALDQAVKDNDLSDKRLDAFATIAGTIGARTADSVISYNTQLDDDARTYNRNVNTAASAALAPLGFIPGSSLAIKSVRVGAATAGVATTWLSLPSKPTNNELTTVREHYENLRLADNSSGSNWRNVVAKSYLAEAAKRGSLQLVVPDTKVPQTVQLRSDGQNTYQWRIPGTKTWENLEPSYGTNVTEMWIGTPMETARAKVAEIEARYIDGVLFAADETTTKTLRSRARLDDGDSEARVDYAIHTATMLDLGDWIAGE